MPNLRWPDTEIGREAEDILFRSNCLAAMWFKGIRDTIDDDDYHHVRACILCAAARAWLGERFEHYETSQQVTNPRYSVEVWTVPGDERHVFEGDDPCAVLAEAVVEMSKEGEQ